MLTLAAVSRTNVTGESFTRAVIFGVFVDVGGIIMNTDLSLDVEGDTEEWVEPICLTGSELHTQAKWFVLWQFRHSRPRAGQVGSVEEYPQ